MADWSTFDPLIHNVALLAAGVMAISLTYQPGPRPRPDLWLALRYLLAVLLGMYLTSNGIVLSDDLRFDFRAVIIAVVARRHGLLPALLVVLPLSLYRASLGGSGMGWGMLQMTLIALLGSLGIGWKRIDLSFDDESPAQRWWRSFTLFATVNLTLFPAAYLAGQPLSEAVLLYAGTSILGAVGLFMSCEILQARLETLAHTTHLRHLASVDSLTGCFNRRQFDADFVTTHPSRRSFLLMMDLDHFKRINDTFGHDTGDRVLVALADTLRESTRSSDCLYRLGGEEFAVLLHDSTLDDAHEVAERIRHAVETTVARRAGLPGERITLSGGLVAVQGDRHQVLQEADGHLYAAKDGGRNRIHRQVTVVHA